jgi:hypothetical protein
MRLNRTQTCEHISEVAAELASLAVAAGIPTLAGLLHMAQLEADKEALASIKKTKAA